MNHPFPIPRLLLRAALGAAVLVPAAVVPAASPADAAVQHPIGFERSVDPADSCDGQSSGVDFNLTPGDIFQEYAAQMSIAGPTDGEAFDQKDKRLIDIEVHADGSGLANYVYDVVWVCNEGDFELESWFVPGLTENEVDLLSNFDDIAILDIERVPKGLEWRFSAIIQRNSGEFDWEVVLDTSDDNIEAQAERQSARVVDYDYNYPCLPGVFCGSVSDAVLIENTGTNFLPTLDMWSSFPAQSPPGFQLADLELHADIPADTNWVASGHPFTVVESDQIGEVVHSHGHTGRIVDLEVQTIRNRSSLGSTFAYHTVNLTNQ